MDTLGNIPDGNQLRLVYESVPDGIAGVGPDGRIVFCNPALAVIAGRSMNDLVGMVWADLIGLPGDIDNQSTRTSYDLTIERPNGDVRAVMVQRLPAEDASGIRLCYVRDITRVRRVKSRLISKSIWLTDFMRIIPAPCYVKNRGGVYVFCNDAFCNLIEGRPWEGATDYDLFDETSATRFRTNDEDVMAEQVPRTFRERIGSGKDATHWISYKFPIRTPGEEIHLGGFSLDVTEDVRTREDLNLKTSLLESVLGEMPITVFATNGKGQLIFMHDRAGGPLRRLKVGADESLFDHLDDAPDLAVAIGEARANRGARSEFTLDDGKAFEGIVVPLLEEGEDLRGGVAGILLDVTRRRAEEVERLRLMREHEEAQKLEALGLLSCGLAHDFNNLLVGIMGNAELGKLESAEYPVFQPLFQQISHAAERAADLTQQMLLLGGRGKPNLGNRVDLCETVRDVVELLRTTIGARTEVLLRLDEDTPRIDGDPVQLRQVVMNFITNAVQAIGSREGRLELAVSTEESGGEGYPQAEYCVLAVADNGRGMSEETRARIFEPFFSTKGSGRGLGLAALRTIVRGHGGVIQVESEEGKGTRFRVFLPVPEKGVSATRERWDETTRTLGGHVLLIESFSEIRIATKTILEQAGFNVIAREETLPGQELAGTPFAVILLDSALLPDETNLASRLLKDYQRRAPVILTTVRGTPAVHPRLQSFARVVLAKPFSPRTLLSALHRARSGIDETR